MTSKIYSDVLDAMRPALEFRLNLGLDCPEQSMLSLEKLFWKRVLKLKFTMSQPFCYYDLFHPSWLTWVFLPRWEFGLCIDGIGKRCCLLVTLVTFRNPSIKIT